MRKKLLTMVASLFAVLTLGAVMASPAMADSPHYLKGSPSVTVANNSLTVAWKAAGLGNTVTSADFALNGTITATAQCFTKSGNPVNGQPKTATTNVSTSKSFPVRNGSVTGEFVVSPLVALTCTGSQVVTITAVTFDLTLTGDSLPPVHLTS